MSESVEPNILRYDENMCIISTARACARDRSAHSAGHRRPPATPHTRTAHATHRHTDRHRDTHAAPRGRGRIGTRVAPGKPARARVCCCAPLDRIVDLREQKKARRVSNLVAFVARLRPASPSTDGNRRRPRRTHGHITDHISSHTHTGWGTESIKTHSHFHSVSHTPAHSDINLTAQAL